MYLITEFSKLTAVSVRMLRYYDKHDIFKPIKVDPDNQYRYYSASQMNTLNKIKVLRDFGFNVTEIKEVLSLDETSFKTILIEKQVELSLNLQKQLELLNKIQRLTDDDNHSYNFEIDLTLKEIPPLQVLSLRKRIPTYFHEELLWKEFSKLIKDRELKMPKEYLSFTIFHDLDYRDENVDVEVVVEFRETHQAASESDLLSYVLPGHPLAASIMVVGSYHNIDPAYQAFAQWLENHPQYQMDGKTRQINHKGPWNCREESEYITELMIPIKLRK